MAKVMSTTIMPMLLLGGDVDITAGDTLETWREALALPTVRGVVAGRSLLYPKDGDVAGAVDTAVALLAEAKA
jgi:Cgl0159-like